VLISKDNTVETAFVGVVVLNIPVDSNAIKSKQLEMILLFCIMLRLLQTLIKVSLTYPE
jgi:hypothetical protein